MDNTEQSYLDIECNSNRILTRDDVINVSQAIINYRADTTVWYRESEARGKDPAIQGNFAEALFYIACIQNGITVEICNHEEDSKGGDFKITENLHIVDVTTNTPEVNNKIERHLHPVILLPEFLDSQHILDKDTFTELDFEIFLRTAMYNLQKLNNSFKYDNYFPHPNLCYKIDCMIGEIEEEMQIERVCSDLSLRI